MTPLRAGVRSAYPRSVRADIDHSSTEPPFEQLRRGIAGQVADGTLPAGTKLPTVRALAEQVGLAVNTVARAYRELENDGIVVTQGRRGTFVASAALDAPPAGVVELAQQYVAAARRQGLSVAEATSFVERAWGVPHD